MRLFVCVILSTFFLATAFSAFAYDTLFVQDIDDKAQTLAHYTMGLIYDWNGSLDKAVESLEKATQIESDNYSVALRLGASYGRLGDFEKAVVQLKKAATLRPKDVQAHYLLAIIYSSQSKEEEATDEYELILQKVIEKDPDSSEGYAYLGQLYYSQGRITPAIEQFEKVLTLNSNDAEILSILGSLFLEVPNRKKAIEFFKRSIKNNPKHDGSLNSLGYMYAEDGINLGEARELVKRSLEVDPENGAYLDSMGWVYYKQGDYEKAVLFLERAIKFIEDPIVYDHLGDAYLGLKKPQKALENWEKSLEMLPDQENVLKKIQENQTP
ncbi:MAG: tetratricopeptide repeat protein [Candidatus Aceula meridiana]|nr:tetratricopeptide repeat protein [Candidatus Aceula meridiana]